MSGHVTVVEALTAAVQHGIKAVDTQTPQLVTSAVYLTLLKRQKTPKPVSRSQHIMLLLVHVSQTVIISQHSWRVGGCKL